MNPIMSRSMFNCFNYAISISVFFGFMIYNTDFLRGRQSEKNVGLFTPEFVKDKFKFEKLTGNELRILNVNEGDTLNGSFLVGDRLYRLFICVWNDSKGFLAGRNHNPDYCWKYAGWSKCNESLDEVKTEIGRAHV